MAGGGGGQQQPKDVTQTFKPWGAQKPYLKEIYRTAGDLADKPFEMYPDSMLAARDPATLEALGLTEERARAGSDLTRGSQDYVRRVLGGEYLGANPYIDATYDRAATGVTRNFEQSVLPALESRFAMAGRMGSGAYGNSLGEAGRQLASELSGLATDIYGENYARERGIMDSAARFAPQLAEADYADFSRLGAVGAEREARSQAELDELVERFNFAQEEPWMRLARYSGTIGAPVGGQATDYAHASRTRNPTWYDPAGLFGWVPGLDT